MDVTREHGQLTGVLTRVEDGARVPFGGILEMLAALEQLEAASSPQADDDPRPAAVES